MTSNKWVDNATRALIFEILFYNVNSNLFSDAAIFFEIGPEDFVTVAFKVLSLNTLMLHSTLLVFLDGNSSSSVCKPRVQFNDHSSDLRFYGGISIILLENCNQYNYETKSFVPDIQFLAIN